MQAPGAHRNGHGPRVKAAEEVRCSVWDPPRTPYPNKANQLLEVQALARQLRVRLMQLNGEKMLTPQQHSALHSLERVVRSVREHLGA